ncbi:MAG TPA: SDR family NAD(P)-dependent oxidoreductase [Roseiarcus sp.]|nr:SDR family NAD(P)-dependent oxidoreductase [Roseiarcus sp.]
MQGKIVAATGATSGIGEKAVEALARQGTRIVLIARNRARADATLAWLERVASGLGHRAHFAGPSLMREAKRVGAEIAASELRIDVLINNAGAIFGDRCVTTEGFERTFALNHMS